MNTTLDCIAMREFPDASNSNKPHVLKIFRPMERDDGRSFGCRFDFLIDDVVVKSQTLVGVDSIQALISALAAAALEMELTKRRREDWFVDDLMRIKT